jgi:hypothetical protein
MPSFNRGCPRFIRGNVESCQGHRASVETDTTGLYTDRGHAQRAASGRATTYSVSRRFGTDTVSARSSGVVFFARDGHVTREGSDYD